MAPIPDIDIHLNIPHRGPTHSIWFAILAGVVYAAILAYSSVGGLSLLATAGVGFGSGFAGVIGHIAGDMITPMGVAPLEPGLFQAGVYLIAGAIVLGTVGINGIIVVPGKRSFTILTMTVHGLRYRHDLDHPGSPPGPRRRSARPGARRTGRSLAGAGRGALLVVPPCSTGVGCEWGRWWCDGIRHSCRRVPRRFDGIARIAILVSLPRGPHSPGPSGAVFASRAVERCPYSSRAGRTCPCTRRGRS